MDLLRCLSCNKILLFNHAVKREGQCKCGGRKFRGARATGLMEKLTVFWWELTERS